MAALGVNVFSSPLAGMMKIGMMFGHGNHIGAAFVLFALGIGEFQLHAPLFRLVLNRLRLGSPPRTFGSDLGKADGQRLGSGLFAARRGISCGLIATSEKRGEGQRGTQAEGADGNGEVGFHSFAWVG